MSSKKKSAESAKPPTLVFEVDPTECPFREFKDNELSPDLWGLGPAACRAATLMGKVPKPPSDSIWIDEQTQPLPRSVRQYLHGWIRAEELAEARWEAGVLVFEEGPGAGKMSVSDIQLSHAQVLTRSSFCRKVLSACFILERVEGLMVEHQWENFMCNYTPEGWRARYHIYSPGMKSGGGQQHRPVLSKNGCYMVRLYYLGAWRCVWVSDQIPVDATDAPLLPFSPLLSRVPPPKPGPKVVPTTVTSSEVYLWPLLICKALLKLAAPDMSSDEYADNAEDELMPEFDILHALTGCMTVTHTGMDYDALWQLFLSEVAVFYWDEDDETLTSTVRTKSTKKPTAKEATYRMRNSMATIVIKDTKNHPPYWLPGITPGYEMSLLVSMIRDVPLKKPLPEPEVALWKCYRWIHWAKMHGLYEDYDCPRTKFVKVNGLMKLSCAPHLLDVISTESITMGFREEHEKTTAAVKNARGKEAARSQNAAKAAVAIPTTQMKEELREWIQFEPLQLLIRNVVIGYYPSAFQCASAASCPPIRITKTGPTHADMPVPKSAPLYLQLDGPDVNFLRLSLTSLHPRILINSGIPIEDYIEKAYLILEKFEWFEECSIPIAKAFVQTRGYDAVEVMFQPGRHFFRLWVHSRMNFHIQLLTESSLILGSRDVIQAAAVHECPWASRFLNSLGTAFTNWIKMSRSNTSFMFVEKEFFRSYQPDLVWYPEVVGYNQALLHWMFRQALQKQLHNRLPTWEYQAVCTVLRYYFQDPDFGLPVKPKPTKPVREIVAMDPCDCTMPESEMVEAEYVEEETVQTEELPPLVSSDVMELLLAAPVFPVVSQTCQLATEDLPCGILKEEREKTIKKHEAATTIQSHWRGTWARKCLNKKVVFSAEYFKCVMDNAFGNLEALSGLMNQFFGMYPGAKTAYSVASALSGVNGLYQHQGTSIATPKCKWIPYFQGVFYCHAPVKAHFAIQSSLQYSTVMVYDNDTGHPMPQAFNAHVTFDFVPNQFGYTVMGHGTLSQAAGINTEVHWQLVVLSSIDGAFHVCDNDVDGCKLVPMPGSQKLHFNELFIPNRRNILGGILISVSKQEAICFRAAVTSPELEIVATLRSTSEKGEPEELGKCSGRGEIHWPYLRLQSFPPQLDVINNKKRSTSQANLYTADPVGAVALSTRSLPKSSTKTKSPASAKNRLSFTKIKALPVEPKQYQIEVTAPDGWALTLAQWKRVGEVRNSLEFLKIEAVKKPVKPPTGKDKDKVPVPSAPACFIPQPDDAYIELECSLATGGGATARLDDLRALEFAADRKEWDANEPGRNSRGAIIRQEFLTEYLEALPPPPSDSIHTMNEEMYGEYSMEGEHEIKEDLTIQQGPTPATESGMLEMTIESEEETKYLLMPNQLRDKFIPLSFLPFCVKEKNEEESVLISKDMAEAAKQDRRARMDASLERLKELQIYNQEFVLQRQKRRWRLLETLFVDSTWSVELVEALEHRDEAIAQENLLRQLSATKKKDSRKK